MTLGPGLHNNKAFVICHSSFSTLHNMALLASPPIISFPWTFQVYIFPIELISLKKKDSSKIAKSHLLSLLRSIAPDTETSWLVFGHCIFICVEKKKKKLWSPKTKCVACIRHEHRLFFIQLRTVNLKPSHQNASMALRHFRGRLEPGSAAGSPRRAKTLIALKARAFLLGYCEQMDFLSSSFSSGM